MTWLISSDGILVELDAAVVTGAHLLAAVEQRGREAGSVPRRLIADARPSARCDVRPGRREIDSAIDVSGSLPMSSAEIASTMLIESCFDGDRAFDARADAGDDDFFEPPDRRGGGRPAGSGAACASARLGSAQCHGNCD
jgi:hypothetical protein